MHLPTKLPILLCLLHDGRQVGTDSLQLRERQRLNCPLTASLELQDQLADAVLVGSDVPVLEEGGAVGAEDGLGRGVEERDFFGADAQDARSLYKHK